MQPCHCPHRRGHSDTYTVVRTCPALPLPPDFLSLRCFSKIALRPNSIFLLVLTTKILTVARDRDIAFLFHEVGHRSHHLHLPYARVRGQINFLYLLLSGRVRRRQFVVCCTLPHSLYVFIPAMTGIITTPPPPSYPPTPPYLSLSDFSLYIFLRPQSVPPYRSSYVPQQSLLSAALQLVSGFCSD